MNVRHPSFLSKTFFMIKWTSDFLFSCNDLIHFTNWYLAKPPENKTGGFLMFSGGIERDKWHEIG